MAIWYILWSFGTFCGHLVHFVVTWYIFSHFGILYQEKSGNPDLVHQSSRNESTVHIVSYRTENLSKHRTSSSTEVLKQS
jgi:hypothetical protein